MTEPEPEKKKTKKERVAALATYESVSVPEASIRSRSIAVNASCYNAESPEFSIEASDYMSGLRVSVGSLGSDALRALVKACERALAFAQNRYIAERLILSDPSIPDGEPDPTKPTGERVSPEKSLSDDLPF